MSGKNEQREGFIEQNVQSDDAKEFVKDFKKIVSAIGVISGGNISKIIESPFQVISKIFDGVETAKSLEEVNNKELKDKK